MDSVTAEPPRAETSDQDDRFKCLHGSKNTSDGQLRSGQEPVTALTSNKGRGYEADH